MLIRGKYIGRSGLRLVLGLAFLVAAGLVILLAGCSSLEPDRSGNPTPNSPPKVFPANTPPDSARFSRNPELHWYATDIDGYITFFRYSVIVDTMLRIDGQLVTPEVFITQAPDAQFGWDTLRVDLDHPQSSARIRLYADTLDPVNVFTKQYFFVQAQDDQGAMSDIIFRLYSRNNHYPNTQHRAARTYINAPDINSPAPGVFLTWFGADSTDWGRATPPLEYEWRIYGPFALDADIVVRIVQEDCVWNPVTGQYERCRNVPVLDIDAIPDTILIDINDPDGGPPTTARVPQPVQRSRGPNFANDTTDIWVSDMEVTLYNLYRDVPLLESACFKYVFWVRTRDDGYVPDPSPAFSQFHVYEAKFERDVAIIDEGGYNLNQGRWGPIDLDTVKSVFYNLVHGAGYTDFDTARVAKSDFFYSTAIKNRQDAMVVPLRTGLLDILSHKVLIYYTDAARMGPNEGTTGMLRQIFFGLDMGASSAIFSRNITNTDVNIDRYDLINMSANFRNFYGISSVNIEGWNFFVLSTSYPRRDSAYIRYPVFTEEFIGAKSNSTFYPDIDVDLGVGSLFDVRYPTWVFDTLHVFDGLPEVGVCTKTLFAAPIYLYLSRLGDASIFNGKVCAVRQQLGDMRTACFLFTPLAMDSIPMQEMFTTTLDWLIEKFQTESGTAMYKESTLPRSAFGDIEERRERLRQALEYLSVYATQEELDAWGIEELKPFVVE